MPAPPIDTRGANDILAQTARLLSDYTGWRPGSPPDPGWALVNVFARMAAVVTDRINRVPDKNFVAFLNLIGIEPGPPVPARVPLTFRLTPGGAAAVLPAGTQVAAELAEGETEPVVFETDRDLTVTRTALVAARTLDPRTDRYGVLPAAGGTTGAPIFEGNLPIVRRLYLGHGDWANARGEKTITVQFRVSGSSALLAELEWGYAGETPGTWRADPPFQAALRPAQGDTRTVQLRNVPDLPRTEVAGHTTAWLSARLTKPQPFADPDAVPPPPSLLLVESVRASVEINRKDLAPELGFVNQTAADLSKDFLPFGEKPRVGDVLYLACEEAFALTGAKVRLDVRLSQLGVPTDRGETKVAWEYFDRTARRWKELSAADGTKALTQNGEVVFEVPDGVGAVAVGGESRHWIRARLASGDYGRDAVYEAVGNGQDRRFVLATAPTYKPPVISSVTIGFGFVTAFEPLDLVLAENDFRTRDHSKDARDGVPFEPLVRNPEPRPALYLGFEPPAGEVAFGNLPTTLYAGLAEVAADQLLGGRPAERPQVAWEYWGTRRTWRPLPVRDDTESFRRSELVTFVGPPDIAPSREFGVRAAWLRAVWKTGEFPAPPRARRVLLNTVWGTNALTVTGEGLGSSTGEPNQTFRTTKKPVLPGERVDVAEPEPPPAAERAELGPAAVSAGGPPVWVRWVGVPDFYDSGPRSRHYVIDRLTGAVRFGDGRRGMVPPPGRAAVRASYRTAKEASAAGNDRAAGTVTQLKRAVPYVAGVRNEEPSGGGADAETVAAAQDRGPRTLRHRDRGVAAADYEDLARQASSEVARVRAAVPEGGGRVVLRVLPRGRAARPSPSLELLSVLEAYLRPRMAATAALDTAGPDWLEVAVEVELVSTTPEQTAAVKVAAAARLAEYLHPVRGRDGAGWDFGESPQESDFYLLLEAAPGVDHVARLVVRTTPAAVPPGAVLLVCAGDLDVTVFPTDPK